MDKFKIYELLISLVRHQMTGIQPSEHEIYGLNEDVIEKLYIISHKLDFAHIIYSSLKELGVSINEETGKNFKKSHQLAVHRAALIEYEQLNITELLKKENIPFVLLKGAVIRTLYPKNVVRTSCDIDILIKLEHMQKSTELLLKNSYKISANNFHDTAFESPAGAKVELHFSIAENGMEGANKQLESVWDNTTADDKGNITFTKEFFLFHHFTHMAYHFVNGGCGIKPLIDLYVIERKMGVVAVDIKELLDKAELYKFAVEMSELSKAMFDGELSDFHMTLLSYLIEGGVYGRIDNKVALGKTKSGGTFGYLLKRFFLPYKDMKDCYPILSKLPFLLPVFWIVRIFHRLFSKDRERFVSELGQSACVSKEKVNDVKEIQKRLGL